MMIGPDPMTRTLWMSVRLGMSGVLPVGHEIAEPVEEVRRIVRAGCRLGVVLDREARQPAVGVAELESSTTSSLRHTWLTDASPNSVVVEPSSGASTAKPWL